MLERVEIGSLALNAFSILIPPLMFGYLIFENEDILVNGRNFNQALIFNRDTFMLFSFFHIYSIKMEIILILPDTILSYNKYF